MKFRLTQESDIVLWNISFPNLVIFLHRWKILSIDTIWLLLYVLLHFFSFASDIGLECRWCIVCISILTVALGQQL